MLVRVVQPPANQIEGAWNIDGKGSDRRKSSKRPIWNFSMNTWSRDPGIQVAVDTIQPRCPLSKTAQGSIFYHHKEDIALFCRRVRKPGFSGNSVTIGSIFTKHSDDGTTQWNRLGPLPITSSLNSKEIQYRTSRDPLPLWNTACTDTEIYQRLVVSETITARCCVIPKQMWALSASRLNARTDDGKLMPQLGDSLVPARLTIPSPRWANEEAAIKRCAINLLRALSWIKQYHELILA